jgi:glycosyltransferase involved in cell wall biosynthesis
MQVLREPDRPEPEALKVVWLSHGYGYGGDLMYFAPIFARFSKRFPRTEIFVDRSTFERNPAFSTWFRKLGFFSFRIRRTVRGVAYETELRLPSPTLFARLAGTGLDVAVEIEITPVALAGLLFVKFVLNRPVLLLVECDPAYRGAGRGGAWGKVKAWVAQQADLVMTNNRLGDRYVRETLGVAKERVLVAPYLTSELPADGLRPRLAGAESLKLLYINALTDRKGIEPLLEALVQLEPKVRDGLRLRVIGDGPLMGWAQGFVAGNGLSEIVEFTGRVPYADVGPIYADADVFISPTLGDYRSLAGFECLSAGLPVLLSRYDGAHEETVREAENGFVIDPMDVKGMADRLRWIVANRRELPSMGAVSSQMAKAFSFDAIADNLQEAVLRVAGDRALGSRRG